MTSPEACEAPRFRARATPSPGERNTVTLGQESRKSVEWSVESSSTTINSTWLGGAVWRRLVAVASSSLPSLRVITTTLIRGVAGSAPGLSGSGMGGSIKGIVAHSELIFHWKNNSAILSPAIRTKSLKPGLAGGFGHAEYQELARDGEADFAQVDAWPLHHFARLVKVGDGESGAGGPAVGGIDVAAPDAPESVRLGDKIDVPAIPRPGRLPGLIPVARYGDELRGFGGSVGGGRDQVDGLLAIPHPAEQDPAPVRGPPARRNVHRRGVD